MHIVFLNQYYPPDAAPTGVVLRDLAETLVRNGHDVTVLCAEGGYADEKIASVQCPVFSEEENEKTQDARLEEEANGSAQSSSSTCDSSSPRILRIRAFRFGRGSSVGKLLDYLSYYLGVSWKLMVMQPRPDRVVALTTPPYLSLLARVGSRLRGADHAHWVMDLYPDVMVSHGMLKEKGLIHRLMNRLTCWGFGGKRCAGLLTIGPDMADRIEKHMVGRSCKDNHRAPLVSWVPLWGTGNAEFGTRSDALRRERGWAANDLVLMYSGNMGLGHRFGEILAVARDFAEMSDRDQNGLPNTKAATAAPQNGATKFVFFGKGGRRQEILEFIHGHPSCDVELHDYAASEILAEHLESADVHLVSLDASWTGTMVPSKLQGVFAAGRPVIFIGSEHSSIWKWVVESGGGWVIRQGDVTSLREVINEARDPDVRLARGRAARAYAARHFDREMNCQRVACLLAGE